MRIDLLRPVWHPLTWLAFIALPFIGPHLPLHFGWKSGPFELFQAFILFIGGCISLYIVFRPKPDISLSLANAVPKALLLAITFIWWFMCLRELSWGAVFLPPLGFDPIEGYKFSAREQLPYYTAIHIVCGILAFFSFLAVIRCRYYLLAYWKVRRFPLPEVILAIVMQLFATTAEGYLLPLSTLWLAMGVPPQIVEEWCELLSYLSLLVGQIIFLFNRR